MEKLLHYAWKCRIQPLHQLFTTDGREVEIIDPGLSNPNAGPDFFNAKLRIGETMWAGNVEIHLRSSDWYRHGHDSDAAYDNIILHVVGEADMEVNMSNGKIPPQLVFQIPNRLKEDYQTLLTTMDYPRCHSFVPSISKMLVHSWMDALLCERLSERSERVLQRLRDTGGDWNHTLMITLARNFGFSLNGDAFERWAKILPLSAARKHADDLFQIEALFLGTAGLLEKRGDEQLSREYAYLAHKFALTDVLSAKDWRYMRTRPQNFPHVRIAQLALLFQQGRIDVSRMLEIESAKGFYHLFDIKGLSKSSMDLLIINTVVPVFYAYGIEHNDERYQDRAIALLEQLKAENNYILRQWEECGISVKTAADSQALIQLKREYCDRKDCLRCRFGYEFLKKKE